jgi:hypothetical protein
MPARLMEQTFPLNCTLSVGYLPFADNRHQGLPWAAYLPQAGSGGAPVAVLRARTSLRLAVTIALLAVVAFVGWAWVSGGDHSTWMGDSPATFMVTAGCVILLTWLLVGAAVGIWRLLASEPPDLDPG